MSRRRIPERLEVWIDVRKRHHLSHAQVQMARELGMNPKKLGKLDNLKPQAGTLEAAAPGVHRAPVLQTVRQAPSRRRHLDQGTA